MDNSSVASEIPDLLQFLRPSVKNVYEYNLLQAETPYPLSASSKYCRKRYLIKQQSKITSSPSLVLTKYTKRPRKVCSKSEVDSKIKSKQIVEVIVIPKKQKEIPRNCKSRYHRHKTQETVFNQNNPVLTKNVYLIVSGRKRDKVFEVKTTKSTEYFNDNDDHPKNESDLKQILTGLNMEKKITKKKEKQHNVEKITIQESPSLLQNVLGSNNIDTANNKDVTLRKSRVRIIGRLGLTQDDKYVLKCAATIDDEPIETLYAQDERYFLPENIVYCNENQQPQMTNRGNITQTDDNYVNKNRAHQNKNILTGKQYDKEIIYTINRKGSQGTQVNLNLFFPSKKNNDIQNNQVTQYACCKFKDIATYTDKKNIILRDAETQNPLVSNSVFPKHKIVDVHNNKKSKEHEYLPSKVNEKILSQDDIQNTTVKQRTQTNVNSSPPRPRSKNLSKGSTKSENKRSGTKIFNVRPRSSSPKPAAETKPTISQKPILLSSQNSQVSSIRRPPSPNLKSPEVSSARNQPKNNVSAKSEKKMSGTKIFNMRPRSVSPKPGAKNKITISQKQKLLFPQESQVFSLRRPPSPILKSPEVPFARNRPKNYVKDETERKLTNARRTDTELERNKIIKKTNHLNVQNTKGLKKTISKDVKFIKKSHRNSAAFSGITKNVINQETKGTNTDHTLTKKAIIESYTRRLEAQMGQKNHHVKPIQKNEVSNVSINIDADNEFYDLLFHQDSISTDLTVKKRNKTKISNRDVHDGKNSGSLENFILIPEEEQRERSISQTYKARNKLQNAPMLPEVTSKLNCRDSIEISHRREDKSAKNTIKITQTNYCGKYTESDFLAPVKHYRGDDCPITDPIKRDKEIRELLGVQNGRTSSSKANKQLSESNKKEQVNAVPVYENILHTFRWKIERNLNKPENPSLICDTESKLRKLQHLKKLDTISVFTQYDISLLTKASKHFSLFPKASVKIARQKKSKAIQLSYIKYQKVRRSIQQLLLRRINETQRKRVYKRISLISISEIRRKSKIKRSIFFHKETQTDLTEEIINYIKKGNNCREVTQKIFKTDQSTFINQESFQHMFRDQNKAEQPRNGKKESKTIVLFSAKEKKRLKKKKAKEEKSSTKSVLSSIEIHYANIEYKKQFAHSSTNIQQQKSSLDIENINCNNIDTPKEGICCSVETIYRGRRRCATPNLGTSVFSLYPERGIDKFEDISMEHLRPEESKQKKPFLKRLISCLMMRATSKISKLKLQNSTPTFANTSNIFTDPYYINTSLAPIEMSSSIYDTSISFYSKHTILPVTGNSKRGFFGSVLGLLRSR